MTKESPNFNFKKMAIAVKNPTASNETTLVAAI